MMVFVSGGSQKTNLWATENSGQWGGGGGAGITGRVRISCAVVRTAFLPGKQSLSPGQVCEVTVSLLGQRSTRRPHTAMSLFSEQVKPETKQKHSHQNQEEKKPLSSYKVSPVSSTDKA